MIIDIKIPEGPLFDNLEVECGFDTDEGCLCIKFQKKDTAEYIARSLFKIPDWHLYMEDGGRIWVKRCDMNGSPCWDDYGDGSLESLFSKGDDWKSVLYRSAMEQLGHDISQVYTETVCDGTSDYLALGGSVEDLVDGDTPFPFCHPDTDRWPDQVISADGRSMGNALEWGLPYPVPENLPRGLHVAYAEPWDNEDAIRRAEELSGNYDRHESTVVCAVTITSRRTVHSRSVIISDSQPVEGSFLVKYCHEPCCTSVVYSELCKVASGQVAK